MDIKCTVCDGTDFVLDGGFYFCTECQTQTQEHQEQVYDLDETTQFNRSSRKTLKKQKSKDDGTEKLTSWEGYNYILIGFVEEMIRLGASQELKLTVLQLWAAYLSKTEVAFTSKQFQNLPKLSAMFKSHDVEIIYDRKRCKRKKKVSKSNSSTNFVLSEDQMSFNEQVQQKRKDRIIKQKTLRAEYELSQKSKEETNSSFCAQSLNSIQSSSGTSQQSTVKKINLSSVGRKECLKKLTRNHLKKHLTEEFTCHKFTRSLVTTTYVESPHHLTKLKLFSILYLGLLINGEKIQLGDMIRFCREGHLSYVVYEHLFPEHILMDIDIKKIFKGGKQCLPFHYEVRQCTAMIAKFIGVKNINSPNIMELCEQYVKELALPLQVISFIRDIYEKYPPKMKFCSSKSKLIPNYEGRAMAYIVFAMKFLFGLNGISETIISDIATELNGLKVPLVNRFDLEVSNLVPDDSSLIINFDESYSHKTFFVWSTWTKYIECRKAIIIQKHFPTSFCFNSENLDVKALVNFWKNQNFKFEHKNEYNLNIQHNLFKSFFTKLIPKTKPVNFPLTFKPTLTPFYSYLNAIIENDSNVNDLLNSIQKIDFSVTDIKFIVDFLDILNSVNLKKIKQISKVKILTKYVKRFKYNVNSTTDKVNEFNKLVDVKVTLKKKRKRNYDSDSDNSTLEIGDNNKYLKLCDLSRASIKANISSKSTKSVNSDELHRCKQISKNNTCETNKSDESIRTLLQFPQKNYWLLHGSTINFKNHMFDKIKAKFPESFTWLLNECARTAEMSSKDLYSELICVEVYLGFVEKPTNQFFELEQNHPEIQVLYKHIKSAKKDW